MVPLVHAELSFVLQHRGLTVVFQYREGLTIWRIELSLIVRSKASERKRRHHERRVMKSGVSITKTRERVWAAGARGETHIHRRFPCMNPGLESCSEFGIEEESGPQGAVILDVFDDVMDLGILLAAQLALYLVSEHLADAGLAYLVDGGMPELIDGLPPLMTGARHQLHLIDSSRNVDREFGSRGSGGAARRDRWDEVFW